VFAATKATKRRSAIVYHVEIIFITYLWHASAFCRISNYLTVLQLRHSTSSAPALSQGLHSLTGYTSFLHYFTNFRIPDVHYHTSDHEGTTPSPVPPKAFGISTGISTISPFNTPTVSASATLLSYLPAFVFSTAIYTKSFGIATFPLAPPSNSCNAGTSSPMVTTNSVQLVLEPSVGGASRKDISTVGH